MYRDRDNYWGLTFFPEGLQDPLWVQNVRNHRIRGDGAWFWEHQTFTFRVTGQKLFFSPYAGGKTGIVLIVRETYEKLQTKSLPINFFTNVFVNVYSKMYSKVEVQLLYVFS